MAITTQIITSGYQYIDAPANSYVVIVGSAPSSSSPTLNLVGNAPMLYTPKITTATNFYCYFGAAVGIVYIVTNVSSLSATLVSTTGTYNFSNLPAGNQYIAAFYSTLSGQTFSISDSSGLLDFNFDLNDGFYPISDTIGSASSVVLSQSESGSITYSPTSANMYLVTMVTTGGAPSISIVANGKPIPFGSPGALNWQIPVTVVCTNLTSPAVMSVVSTGSPPYLQWPGSYNFSVPSGTTTFNTTLNIYAQGATLSLYIFANDTTDNVRGLYFFAINPVSFGNPVEGLITINPSIVYNPTLNQIIACNVDGPSAAFPVKITPVNGAVYTTNIPNNTTSFNVTASVIPNASSPQIVSCIASTTSIIPNPMAYQSFVYTGSKPPINPGACVIFWAYSDANFDGYTSIVVTLCMLQSNAGTVNISYTVPAGFSLVNLPNSVSVSGITQQNYSGILSITGSPSFPCVLTATQNGQSTNMTLHNNSFWGNPPHFGNGPGGGDFPNTYLGLTGTSGGKPKRRLF